MSKIHKIENLSIKTRQKLSDNMKQRNKETSVVFTEEIRNKMSEKAKIAAKNRKPISDITREKMRQSALKRKYK